MTNKATREANDAADAAAISNAGWRQGSVFDPRTGGVELPGHFVVGTHELLMVCTQSCSVVSHRFAADPLVELMVVTPLAKYKDRAPESIGKNVRRLHIKLSEGADVVAIECDMNRRFFCDRRSLVKTTPLAELYIGEESASKLAAWLGRAYTRVALPDELVARMRAGLLGLLDAALATPYGAIADPVHAEVPYIYLSWDPRGDNADTFALRFQFVCNELGAVEVLDEALITALGQYENEAVRDGIRIRHWECKLASETFLTDLDGYERFSEWDHLSNLTEVEDPRQ